MKTPFTGKNKRWVHLIRMLYATKVLVSSQISKEHPHVQVKDLIRSVLLVTQTSPTSADAQIRSQTIVHCCLSCVFSYQSPIPSVLISNITRSLQRILGPCLEWVFINSPKSNWFGSLLLSILTRCPSHLH